MTEQTLAVAEKKDQEPFDPTDLEEWVCKYGVNGADRMLTIKEAAYLLGTTADWLYRHWRRLPFKKELSPKQIRFAYQGLQEYIASR